MNNHRNRDMPAWLAVTFTIGLLCLVAVAGWVAGLAASAEGMGW